MTLPTAGSWVLDWLSPPRIAVYLAVVGSDQTRALALYEWNTAVSVALMHDLAHVEVGLRNAYDNAMLQHCSHGPAWIEHPLTYFPPALKTAKNKIQYDPNERARDQISGARNAAAEAMHRAALAAWDAKGGQPRPVKPVLVPPGKIVAELMMGFWRFLSSSAHEKTLWVPYLRHGFPANVQRKHVDESIAKLYRLRNRVAHHEPLFPKVGMAASPIEYAVSTLTMRHNDILQIASWLVPELSDLIAATTKVPGILANAP